MWWNDAKSPVTKTGILSADLLWPTVWVTNNTKLIIIAPVEIHATHISFSFTNVSPIWFVLLLGQKAIFITNPVPKHKKRSCILIKAQRFSGYVCHWKGKFWNVYHRDRLIHGGSCLYDFRCSNHSGGSDSLKSAMFLPIKIHQACPEP